MKEAIYYQEENNIIMLVVVRDIFPEFTFGYATHQRNFKQLQQDIISGNYQLIGYV
jgi:hypothetical protein